MKIALLLWFLCYSDQFPSHYVLPKFIISKEIWKHLPQPFFLPKKPVSFHCQKNNCILLFTSFNCAYKHGFLFLWSQWAELISENIDNSVWRNLNVRPSVSHLHSIGWQSGSWNYFCGSHSSLKNRENGSCWGSPEERTWSYYCIGSRLFIQWSLYFNVPSPVGLSRRCFSNACRVLRTLFCQRVVCKLLI